MNSNPSLKNSIILPSHEHAIEVMALAIEWKQPLSPLELADICKFALNDEERKNKFPIVKRFPGFEVKVDANQASVIDNNFEIVDFVRFNDKDVQELTLSIRPDFVSCSCSIYTKWSEIKPLLLHSILLILRGVNLTEKKIGAIGMQYTDSFKWLKTNDFVLKSLIRTDTPILPASFMSKDPLWHSHNGWYSKSSSKHRVLNIFNCDLVEENEYKVLKINGQHRMQSMSYDNQTEVGLTIEDLDVASETLHYQNKLALQELLSDETLELINFKKVNFLYE